MKMLAGVYRNYSLLSLGAFVQRPLASVRAAAQTQSREQNTGGEWLRPYFYTRWDGAEACKALAAMKKQICSKFGLGQRSRIRLFEDNDPSQKSGKRTEWAKAHNVSPVEMSPYSPDCSIFDRSLFPRFLELLARREIKGRKTSIEKHKKEIFSLLQQIDPKPVIRKQREVIKAVIAAKGYIVK